MSKKEKFTFRQALFNVVIAVSVVIGLSLTKGISFYGKPENVIVILVLISVALITLIAKWRMEKREDKKPNLEKRSRDA